MSLTWPSQGRWFWAGRAVAGVGAVEQDESDLPRCSAGACASVGLEGGEGGERVVVATAGACVESGPSDAAVAAGVELGHGVSDRGCGEAVLGCGGGRAR